MSVELSAEHDLQPKTQALELETTFQFHAEMGFKLKVQNAPSLLVVIKNFISETLFWKNHQKNALFRKITLIFGAFFF